jgi:mannose-1-phosphate guanylyltransferase
MNAVVLVGGEGTRMRPLTETLPKPLIPLVDRPILHHVLDHLASHGVREAILSSPYLEATFSSFIAERHGEPILTWLTEPTPLGTGGAIANAARHFEKTFLALNGDVLTDLDLTALVDAHRGWAAASTIALTPVDDARPYGLVELDDRCRVERFREKPTERIPGRINAGTYVMQPETIRDVPADRPVSIEREIFPALIAKGARVFGFESPAYWMDLGTPERYLRATFDILEGRVAGLSYVAPFVEPTAEVSLRAHLGRWVVVGPHAEVGPDAQVEDSVLLARVRVEAEARVRDSVVGPRVVIGKGAVVEGAVLGEGASVGAGARCRDARVGAGQRLA